VPIELVRVHLVADRGREFPISPRAFLNAEVGALRAKVCKADAHPKRETMAYPCSSVEDGGESGVSSAEGSVDRA
jgi:hypothetical protein